MVESTSEQAKSSTNHPSSPGKEDPQTISEEEEMKRKRRAKNAEAARKCRLAKREKIKSLEQQVAKLISKNNELETDVKILEFSSSIVESTGTSSSHERSNPEESSSTFESTSSSRKRSNCDSPTISDELAIKRARNTEAARKSRQLKKDKMISLEQQVAKLTLKNTELETDIKVLQAEKKSLKRKDKDNKNAIKMLECKLTELTEVLK